MDTPISSCSIFYYFGWEQHKTRGTMRVHVVIGGTRVPGTAAQGTRYGTICDGNLFFEHESLVVLVLVAYCRRIGVWLRTAACAHAVQMTSRTSYDGVWNHAAGKSILRRFTVRSDYLSLFCRCTWYMARAKAVPRRERAGSALCKPPPTCPRRNPRPKRPPL